MTRNLPVPQPSFLPQPCSLPPLLVSETDASRLLGVSRAAVKWLIADRHLQVVEINGTRRVVMASISSYVDRLVAEPG